jgi:hypothetical protein
MPLCSTLVGNCYVTIKTTHLNTPHGETPQLSSFRTTTISNEFHTHLDHTQLIHDGQGHKGSDVLVVFTAILMAKEIRV